MNKGYFHQLLEKAKTTTNSEEAKKIRKILLSVGGGLLLLGIFMVIKGFTGFAGGAFGSVQSFGGTSFNPIGHMLTFFFGGIVSMIGIAVLRAGLSIYIAGAASKFLDVREACPTCGDKIDADERVCSNCGTNLVEHLTCSCGKQNQTGDKFCRECGKAL